MSYCGLYKSTKSGCIAEYLSSSREKLDFASLVTTLCDTCKDDHGFRFVNSFIVTGPKVMAQLLETAKNKHWHVEKGAQDSD